MEIQKDIFPIRLKELMDENNQTIYSIGELLHLSAPTISRYMNGLMSPKLTAIQILADNFNVDPVWLMGYDVPKRNFIVKEAESEYLLTKKDEKDISKILENMKKTLTTQEGLMFDGTPATQEDIQSILDAMQIGMEMAKKRNKEKYNPKKNKK